jgi:hypothetical protein
MWIPVFVHVNTWPKAHRYMVKCMWKCSTSHMDIRQCDKDAWPLACGYMASNSAMSMALSSFDSAMSMTMQIIDLAVSTTPLSFDLTVSVTQLCLRHLEKQISWQIRHR